MVLGSLLNPVNSTLIAVALVSIGLTYDASPAETAWLVTGLYLATAVGQPVVGRLVDLYGPRRLFIFGTVLVGGAGLLGAVAPSLEVLLIARVLIGIGTCAGYPAAMYLVRSEARRTGRDSPQAVLMLLSVSTQMVAAIGPTVGGVLLGLGSWRYIFAINVPLAILALVFGFIRLPKGNPLGKTTPIGRLASLDLAGMMLFGSSLTILMLFLMAPLLSSLYLLAVAALLILAFTLRELRASNPFLDVRILAGNLPLILTYLRQLFVYVGSYGFMYGFVQWLEHTRGLSPVSAGLMMAPLFGVGIIGSAVTGMRPGIVSKLVIGSASMMAGCVFMLFAQQNSALWILLVIAGAVGLAQALVSLANQNALYRQAEESRTASSAGLLRTFTYLGAMFSAVAISLCFPESGADTIGLHKLALLMLGCSAALLLISVADRSLLIKRKNPSK
ncbi:MULTISPECIES: MFS transporter [Actinomycetes]|uniref:MFS transporter n=1 Tax=Actinomycetes TaxID=1760 RepID=UPI000526953A|nr:MULTISPECIES: MFS transporter [Actinomycetes]